MADFSEFQIKEYENISQAHFKSNEVMSTFYRYYILIAVIPITTIALAVSNFPADGIAHEAKESLALIFGVFFSVVCFMGGAIVIYIEGLRLDAILYARVVNSIRDYFFRSDPFAELKFGRPVLPRDKTQPRYFSFGAHYIIFVACAALNAFYAALGFLLLRAYVVGTSSPADVSKDDYCRAAIVFVGLVAVQMLGQYRLAASKEAKGL